MCNDFGPPIMAFGLHKSEVLCALQFQYYKAEIRLQISMVIISKFKGDHSQMSLFKISFQAQYHQKRHYNFNFSLSK